MITNKYNLPLSFVKAIENIDNSYDLKNPDPHTISVTTLIDSPYIAYLTRKHRNEIEVDATDKLASMRGTVVHGVMENISMPNTVTELRINHQMEFADIQKDNRNILWTISGKGDIYDIDLHLLQDYKVLKANSWKYIKYKGYKDEWVNQLNVLRYLYYSKGLIVEKLQIVAIFTELTNYEIMQHDMPDKPVLVIDIPLWELDYTHEYIHQRLKLHSAENIPVCSEKDRWAKASKWALMKEGRKSAVKLYDNRGEADDARIKAGKDHYLEYRQGESTRCGYCDVKKWCQLWK